jgi:hypothetical protein
MEIHVTDDRLGGYFRRYQLAIRMMSHGARTQTVCDWSGLTRDQLVTQRRRWGFNPEERRRGPAPSAFHVFFKSRRRRSEATLFACLCRVLGAAPARGGKRAATRLPGVENGERLCEALEVFQEWQPEADLDFEHAMQLALGVVLAQEVTLTQCSDCHGATLIQGSRRLYATCGHCQPRPAAKTSSAARAAARAGPPLAREQRDQPVIEDDQRSKAERGPDHVPEGEGRSRPGDPEGNRYEDPEDQESPADELDRRRQEHQKP